MHRFRRIVTGLDFDGEGLSLGSRVAARQALWLASRTGARVDFLHSTWVDTEHDDDNAVPVGGEALVAALRKEHGPEVAGSNLVLTEERPWLALTHRVLAGESDLVVVAKRSHGKRDDRKLGSVSMKLVRKCPAPVWVVKPEHGLKHRCVLAATDLSPVGDLATDYGAFVARSDDCQLCVVHAWQMPMELQLSSGRMSDEEVRARREEISEAAREHIRELESVKELGEQAKLYVACAGPSRAILELVEAKNPDLVVMGTISRGGLAGMLVGNTAERLLYLLDCSILTVKPEDFVCPVQPDA